LDLCNGLVSVTKYVRKSVPIFDALGEGCAMLKSQMKQFPRTQCRTILITAGEEVNSKLLSFRGQQELCRKKIVVDVIILGDHEAGDVLKTARVTGGYAFRPMTQKALFRAVSLETMIDIRTRGGNRTVIIDSQAEWGSFQPAEPDTNIELVFSSPPCLPPTHLSNRFRRLRELHKVLEDNQKTHTGTEPQTSFPHASRHVLQEMDIFLASDACSQMEVLVRMDNQSLWVVVMSAPASSPFEGGVFLVSVDIGHGFPWKPPKVRFITLILHPHISTVGSSPGASPLPCCSLSLISR
jgi:ubiquitin-protein ligase